MSTAVCTMDIVLHTILDPVPHTVLDSLGCNIRHNLADRSNNLHIKRNFELYETLKKGQKSSSNQYENQGTGRSFLNPQLGYRDHPLTKYCVRTLSQMVNTMDRMISEAKDRAHRSHCVRRQNMETKCRHG